MKNCILAALGLLVGCTTVVDKNEIAKHDPNMAVEKVVVTNGVQWIDGRIIPIEGRAFSDVDHFYDRLPGNVTTNVNAGVRAMKHHTAGMQARFSTDSKKLRIKWVPYKEKLAMDHMPATGVSGIDVYVRTPGKKWRYVKTGRISNPQGGFVTVDLWGKSNEVIINFPLYNGLKSLKVGIDEKATIAPLPPRASGIDKPVVFYGTSITHGGYLHFCVNADTCHIHREGDSSFIVNLHFLSGNSSVDRNSTKTVWTCSEVAWGDLHYRSVALHRNEVCC